MSSYTQKTRLAFSNLRRLWSRRDFQWRLKGSLQTVVVRLVFLCGSEARPLRMDYLRRPLVFDHRYLGNISKVCHRVMGHSVRWVVQVRNLNRLRGLGLLADLFLWHTAFAKASVG